MLDINKKENIERRKKVNFFKAVLFWVKNKVLSTQNVGTSLQNNSRKRKNCFTLYLQIINLLSSDIGGLELK